MPTFTKLLEDKMKIGSDGVLHIITVRPHVRDDESVTYVQKCFCGDFSPLGFDSQQEAVEAGRTHIQQVIPAPTRATSTSIIRGSSDSRR